MDSPNHRLIELPEIGDARGMLTFAQENEHFPFSVRRIFVLYNLNDGAYRGGHAHRQQHQALLMTAGACTVHVNDGRSRAAVRLCRPSQLLYVPPMRWLELEDFADRAVCLALASARYDELDYIRDFPEFLRLSSEHV